MSQTKKTKFRQTFTIVGLFLGLLIGGGMLSQIKSSQRDKVSLMIIASLTLIGGITGFKIGENLDDDEYIESILGIDKAENGYRQNGRFWTGVTKWRSQDGTEQLIITLQDSNKNLVTMLNGKTIINHQLKSGSRINVEKSHRQATNAIFNQLKEQHKNQKSV